MRDEVVIRRGRGAVGQLPAGEGKQGQPFAPARLAAAVVEFEFEFELEAHAIEAMVPSP